MNGIGRATPKELWNAGYTIGAYDGFHRFPFLPDLDKRTFYFAAGYREGYADGEADQ